MRADTGVGRPAAACAAAAAAMPSYSWLLNTFQLGTGVLGPPRRPAMILARFTRKPCDGQPGSSPLLFTPCILPPLLSPCSSASLVNSQPLTTSCAAQKFSASKQAVASTVEIPPPFHALTFPETSTAPRLLHHKREPVRVLLKSTTCPWLWPWPWLHTPLLMKRRALRSSSSLPKY